MGGITRVLFVNAGLAMGGAEHSLLLLLEGLRAHGVEPTVALFGEGPFATRVASLGVSTACLGPPEFVRGGTRYQAGGDSARTGVMVAAGLGTAVRLGALARRVRADLIHTNGLKAHLLGGLAGRMTGTPVIWHLRDFLPGGFAGRVFRGGARWLPTVIITNSDAVAATIRSNRDDGPRVIRLYNPVDLSRFQPSPSRGTLRREIGLSEDVPLVGLVAHLTPWKGHELFLDIARQVTEAVLSAHFVVAGGPIYETDGHAGYPEALRRRVSALSLGDRVVFLGARDDVPEVLEALDVLVHCPTAPEPFGRALAEAMAAGRPVVASRCGGIPEVVLDGVTGFLAPPGDVKGFASAVVRLLEDPALREQFGTSGRRRAESLFGVAAHTEGVFRLYRSLLGARTGSA